MPFDSALVAALIAAIAGLVIAIVGLIPNVGRLHRLERVVNILEKVKEESARAPLVALRDRLIESLKPVQIPVGLFFLLSILAFVASAGLTGYGIALRTILAPDTFGFAGPLIIGGTLTLLGGLVLLLVATSSAMRARGVRYRLPSRRPLS